MRKTKILAFLLAVVMLVGILHVATFAAYTGDVNAKLEDFDRVIDYDGSSLKKSASISYNNGTFQSNGYVQSGSYNTTYTYYDAEKTKIKTKTFYGEVEDGTVNIIVANSTDPEDANNKVIKLTKHHTFKKTVVSYDENGNETGREVGTQTSDSYYNSTLLDSYFNCATAKTDTKNVDTYYAKSHAAHAVYAGRSFIMSVDFKLGDEMPVGTYFPALSIINTWVAGGSANSNEPVQISAETGEIYYYKVDGSTSRVGTGKLLSKEKYTNITVLFQPAMNTFSLYIDGEYITTQAMMSANDLKEILSADATVANKTVVDVTGLSEEEAARKQGRSFLPTLFRFIQKYPDGYADNLRVYYFNNTTVKGYDLTINGGTLGLNYYLDLNADVLADSTATVDFAIEGDKTVSLPVKDAEYVDGKGYKFTVPVSSVEMAKEITMTINGAKEYYVYDNGVAYGSHTYTVKEYAEELLNDATYGKIAKAMLNYGAYAQKYFAAKNESVAGTLANASCAYTTELSAVNNDVSNVSITGNAPAGTKAALVLDSNTSIVIYDKDGNKIGEKKGINSLQLDTEYTIELTGGTNVKVSVLAIGEKVLESNATSDNYKNLIKALKLFSDASKELNP